MFLSIASYVACEAIISETGLFIETEHYYNMQKLATFPATYFALFLFIFSFALLNRALLSIGRILKKSRSQKIDQ